MTRRIGLYLLDETPERAAEIIVEAVDEAMFYVEHLLSEIEGLESRVPEATSG